MPRGQGPIDAGFGEFPWQAMILKESTKTLICGGAIVDGDLVATAAHCVQGLVYYYTQAADCPIAPASKQI